TPRNGPAGSPGLAATDRARAKAGWITALRAGFSRSQRRIADSTSSAGLIFPRRTSSACAVASKVASSSVVLVTASAYLLRVSLVQLAHSASVVGISRG